MKLLMIIMLAFAFSTSSVEAKRQYGPSDTMFAGDCISIEPNKPTPSSLKIRNKCGYPIVVSYCIMDNPKSIFSCKREGTGRFSSAGVPKIKAGGYSLVSKAKLMVFACAADSPGGGHWPEVDPVTLQYTCVGTNEAPNETPDPSKEVTDSAAESGYCKDALKEFFDKSGGGSVSIKKIRAGMPSICSEYLDDWAQRGLRKTHAQDLARREAESSNTQEPPKQCNKTYNKRTASVNKKPMNPAKYKGVTYATGYGALAAVMKGLIAEGICPDDKKNRDWVAKQEQNDAAAQQFMAQRNSEFTCGPDPRTGAFNCWSDTAVAYGTRSGGGPMTVRVRFPGSGTYGCDDRGAGLHCPESSSDQIEHARRLAAKFRAEFPH